MGLPSLVGSEVIWIHVKGKRAPFRFSAGETVDRDQFWLTVKSGTPGPSEANPYVSRSPKAATPTVLAVFPKDVVLAALFVQADGEDEDD